MVVEPSLSTVLIDSAVSIDVSFISFTIVFGVVIVVSLLLSLLSISRSNSFSRRSALIFTIPLLCSAKYPLPPSLD